MFPIRCEVLALLSHKYIIYMYFSGFGSMWFSHVAGMHGIPEKNDTTLAQYTKLVTVIMSGSVEPQSYISSA